MEKQKTQFPNHIYLHRFLNEERRRFMQSVFELVAEFGAATLMVEQQFLLLAELHHREEQLLKALASTAPDTAIDKLTSPEFTVIREQADEEYYNLVAMIKARRLAGILFYPDALDTFDEFMRRLNQLIDPMNENLARRLGCDYADIQAEEEVASYGRLRKMLDAERIKDAN